MNNSVIELADDEVNFISGGVPQKILTSFVVGVCIGLAIDSYGKGSMGNFKRVVEILEDVAIPVVIFAASLPVVRYIIGKVSKSQVRHF